MKKPIIFSTLLMLVLFFLSFSYAFALKPFNTDAILEHTGVESEKIENEYIGGLKINGATFERVYSGSINSGDITVTNKEELLRALKEVKRGQSIFIAGDARIDLTGENKITVPHGVTLCSDRGRDGSPGALLYTDLHGVSPLFRANGNGVKFAGLRIEGPDTAVYYNITNRTKSVDPINLDRIKKLNDYDAKKDALPRSTGVSIEGAGVEIYNCELYGWTNAAIQVSPSARNTVIRHNH